MKPLAERVRKANSARLRSKGEPILVPLAPVYKKLRQLEPYAPLVRVAKDCGIPEDTMRRWMYKGARDRKAKCYRYYAQRIMAYELPETATTSTQRILGAQRMYLGVAVRGWPMRYICELISLDYDGFRNIVCDGPRVKRGFSPEAYAELRRVVEKLETQDPADVLTGKGPAVLRGKARAQGWADIGAWDLDTVHLESSRPDFTGHCGTLSGFIIHLREGQDPCERCAEQQSGERASALDPYKLKALVEEGASTHGEMAEVLGVSRDLVSKYAVLLDGGRKVHALSNKNALTLRGDCEICGPGVQLYRSGPRHVCANSVRQYRDEHPELNNHGRKPKDEH
jgi:hypothetical protein